MAVTVDDRTYEARLRACARCPMYVATTRQCNPLRKHPATGARGCGCFVALKAKLAREKCPGGSW